MKVLKAREPCDETNSILCLASQRCAFGLSNVNLQKEQGVCAFDPARETN